ncbi:unnamed protein product [Polarella glacialis]|uniref:U-box domain-containing protein n=1 Tax=Polarella glacialis TaxID=89957 RepID=A0A813GSJ8_POLGL|nr:unnamed protein product [Polarella glacialis]
MGASLSGADTRPLQGATVRNRLGRPAAIAALRPSPELGRTSSSSSEAGVSSSHEILYSCVVAHGAEQSIVDVPFCDERGLCLAVEVTGVRGTDRSARAVWVPSGATLLLRAFPDGEVVLRVLRGGESGSEVALDVPGVDAAAMLASVRAGASSEAVSVADVYSSQSVTTATTTPTTTATTQLTRTTTPPACGVQRPTGKTELSIDVSEQSPAEAPAVTKPATGAQGATTTRATDGTPVTRAATTAITASTAGNPTTKVFILPRTPTGTTNEPLAPVTDAVTTETTTAATLTLPRTPAGCSSEPLATTTATITATPTATATPTTATTAAAQSVATGTSSSSRGPEEQPANGSLSDNSNSNNNNSNSNNNNNRNNNRKVPHECRCPISHEIFLDPVLAPDGFTYERACIEEWWQRQEGPRSPMTGKELPSTQLTPNLAMRSLCDEYRSDENCAHGADKMPAACAGGFYGPHIPALLEMFAGSLEEQKVHRVCSALEEEGVMDLDVCVRRLLEGEAVSLAPVCCASGQGALDEAAAVALLEPCAAVPENWSEEQEELFGQLLGIYFPAVRARKAVEAPGVADLEEAVLWLERHQEDVDIDTPPEVLRERETLSLATQVLRVATVPAVHRLACFRALHQLLFRILADPQSERLRRVRLRNARFHARIGRFPQAVALLKAVGFTEGDFWVSAFAKEPGLEWRLPVGSDNPASQRFERAFSLLGFA